MLTEPCFIQGLNNPEDSVPVTAAIQRSAFNWKDISRCERLSCLTPCDDCHKMSLSVGYC